jgi:hypothetical protein
MLISLENKTCIMSENNKKTLPAINNNESGSSKKEIQSPSKEISFGCWCGTASCENCPGNLGMEMEPVRDTYYRNVFSYLKIAAVILIATCIVREALILLQV